jgi:nucleotide-binding universal stress UspA family protein
MFDRILFATTVSPCCDHAASIAFDLAKKYNSKLFLLHVLGFPTREFSHFVVDFKTGKEEQLGPEYVERVRDEIKTTYSQQLAEAVNYVIESMAGVPHTEVLRLARKEDVDLIVMGAHTRDDEVGAARYRSIVGSTMQQVAKRARCPVLIVSRPCTTCFWYFSNVVVATDFSKAAMSAFLFAIKVAKEIGCKIHLFHALDLSSAYAGRTPEQAEIEEKIQEAKKKIEDLYVPKMDGIVYDLEVWEGIPYVEILKFAREKSADLIVMAHHTKEVDLEKALLGSTVEQVVLRSSCPVASVNHPDKLTEQP